MPRGGTLSDFGFDFDPLAESLREARSEARQTQEQVNDLTAQVARNSRQTQSIIDTLTQSMQGLSSQVGQVVTSLQQLTVTQSRGRRQSEQEAATINDMWAAYKKMGVEVESLNLNLKTLQFTEKEMNKVVKLGAEYNSQRSDSYTALSAKYRAIKVLIDQMTVAERENTKEGQAFVAMARDMYEQMNLLQQSTGKYQLQVGDYSKAMTGLNIATQQVVRELPVLANGAVQFAIAISNNVPILMDNIRAVRRSNEAQKALKKEMLEAAAAAEALGNAEEAMALRSSAAGVKTMSVVQGLAKSIFSWQTALVLVLTVLPGVIRKIQEKKKATQELNNETKDAITYTNLLTKAYQDIDSAVEHDITKLRVLYTVTQDYTRSQEDRITAARVLKQEYEEEFANLSEEEILLGNASNAYDELTKKLMEQAKARAYLNKITDLYVQMIEKQPEVDKARLALADAEAAQKRIETQMEAMREAGLSIDEGISRALGKATKNADSARAALQEVDSSMQDIDNTILKLVREIPVGGLLEEIVSGPKGGKTSPQKITDFFYESVFSIIDAMGDSISKQLLRLDFEWEQTMDKYKANQTELQRIVKEGNAQERQEAQRQLVYLSALIDEETKKYHQKRAQMVREALAPTIDSIEETTIDVEKQMASRLKAERAYWETLLYSQYGEALQAGGSEAVQAKETINRTLLDNERTFWLNYLEELEKGGGATIEEYTYIMKQLLALAKGEDTSSQGRGKRGRRYGGIIEAMLAQTTEWGTIDKFGKKVIRDEYMDFVTSADAALKTSMGYMKEWMNARLEMAQVAIDAARREAEAAKKELDIELTARANGYASNIEMARDAYEKQLALERKAIEEKRRLEQIQEAINTAQQISSLVTATANLWAANSGIPAAGPGIAIAATALMWGSFAAAKLQALQLASAKTYGEGGVEYLNYGGSHASGHDIDFGRTPDGRNRRVERGEMVGIINKKNVAKYGVGEIANIISSLNTGTFEDKYGTAFAGMSLAAASSADLSNLEGGVNALVSQGEKRVVVSGDKTIEYYKNTKRIIHS